MTPFEGHPVFSESADAHHLGVVPQSSKVRPTPAATTARRVGFTPSCVVSDTSCRLALPAHRECDGLAACGSLPPTCLVWHLVWETLGLVATVWMPSSRVAS
jgi:hypothetical protein